MGKNYCFTCFAVEELICFLPGLMTYMVYQEEIAPDTGKHHFQGFVQFKEECRLPTLKKLFPAGTHFEVMKGTIDQARLYCMKDESRVPLSAPQEYGDFSKCTRQGGTAKATAQEVVASIRKHSYAQLMDEQPAALLRHPAGVKMIKAVHADSERGTVDRVPNLIWLQGPTGVGKSRAAREIDHDCYVVETANKKFWFDGYQGEKTLLFDDAHPADFNVTQLLRLCDRYPYRVEFKGGHIMLNHFTVIVTTNIPFNLWFYGHPQRAPFLRRFVEFGTCLSWDNEIEKDFIKIPFD